MKPSDKEFQIKAIDYLYGEINSNERKAFEQILKDNPELKAEIDSISFVHDILQKDQEEIPVSTKQSAKEQNMQGTSLFSSTIFQAAASIILIWVIVLSTAVFAGLNINWNDDGFSLSFGETSTPNIQPEAISNNFVTADLLREYSEIQGELISQTLQSEREMHEAQLQRLFEEYATLIENRRLIDLQLIEMELQNQRDQTDRQFQQAEFVLNEIIQFVND